MNRAMRLPRRALLATALLAGFAGSCPAPAVGAGTATARPVLLTGEVIALDSQSIFVPPSDSSPVVLRNFVADGTAVKSGDLVLRIEAQGTTGLSQLQTEAEQAQAKAQREAADLEVKAVEAEKALATAQAALAKALVDAALPRTQISALDFDRYQGERDRAQRDLEVKQKAFANATDAVARRRADGELEMRKLQFNMAFAQARLAESEVHASRDGVVVHGYSEWRGERYEEGSSAFPGNAAGQVIGSGNMQVRAWALEADRPFLSEGQSVHLGFDALPALAMDARIGKIASAPEARASWGNGRYFRIEIELPADHAAPLVPGMSVSIEPQNSTRRASDDSIGAAGELTLEGEIASRLSTPIAPPTIPEIWQFTLAQLAPEGSIVKAGEPIAVFEAPEVATRLETKRSALKEKQRALEKLKLDQAEAARGADLAVSEARSNAEKAARKASQPKDAIRRVDYDKLVIDRRLNEQLAVLAERQREAQIRARHAELAGLQSEIAQLNDAIAILGKGQQALAVIAERTGLVLYRAQFNGEKFTVGSQVWMGLSVATLADPQQLIVNAKVPEAQSSSVRVGQRARVNVPGANLALAARVSALGRTYHGKSKTQPVIVRDVELEFDTTPQGLKPGAAVQAVLGSPSSPGLDATVRKAGIQ